MSGPLRHEKHERFAQLLAKGEKQHEAYLKAGYRGGEAQASRLAARPEVVARIAELLERAAARTELSIASATDRLLKIADKAEQDAQPNGLNVARAAIMDACKLNGLVKDRHEHTGRNGGPIEYANLSDEEIAARIAAHEEARGIRPTTH